MAEEEAKIKKELWWSVPLLILLLIVPFLSFSNILNYSGDSNQVWFQRSGAVMVILAVWIEIKLFAINGDVFPSGLITEQEDRLSKKYQSKYQIVKYLGFVGAVSGTLIWGYGDLIWMAFT